MRSGRLLLVSIVIFLFGISAFAQINPDLEQGMRLYGSYHGGDLDHISMSNGNLFFHGDLMAYSQRGGELAYPIVLQYNGENFHIVQNTCPAGVKNCPVHLVMSPQWKTGTLNIGSSVTVGFDGLPTIIGQRVNTGFTYNGTAIYVTLNSVLTPDGSLHALANTTSGGTMTLDGSGFAGLVDRNGTKFSSSVAEDANGNQISLGTGTDSDTLGRQIPHAPGPAYPAATPPASTASLGPCPSLGYTNQPVSYAYSWNLPTVNGGALGLTLCYASVWVRTTAGATSSGGLTVSQNFTMLQSVVFPDNTYWAFQYDAADPNNTNSVAYGDLLKITLPTGGSISYTWGGCSCATTSGRSVLTRSVDANDGNGPRTWHYSYSGQTTVNGNPTGYTTVTDPLGNDTVHTMTGLGGFESLYETKVQYYQGSQSTGTLLKTVQTDYQYTANVYDSSYASGNGSESITNVFPIRVTTTLANGLVTKTETDYDNALAYHGPLDGITWNVYYCDPDGVCEYTNQQTEPVTNYTGSYGKVIATREYDWGQGAPGPLLRQTFTNYLWQSNSNYLNYNFLDLVSSSTVQDGSGNQVAQTTYGYDEYSFNSAGVSTQFNSNPVNGSIRGNQTSVHHWLNGSSSSTSNCAVSVSNGFAVSYALYNNTGTVYKATEACGASAGDPNHTVTHTYSSSYAGAYPTQTCNALNQCVSGAYDFNTGLLTSFTDANSQTTTYSYDNHWRISQALFPVIDASGVHPETDFVYPNATTVERCKKQNSNSSSSACSTGWIVDYAYFDGLGRTKETRLVDPAGDDFVDTTYDADGRVSTVSNPHRSTSSATDGITTTQYDGLSRLTQVTKQDGSISSVQYDLAAGTANCTLSTDEAGKQRKTCSDGLGRLTRVFEDPAGLNYETDYQYDTLGNLLQVNQKGSAASDSTQWRTRTFTYDSLSRLLTTNNPESGQISYAYDVNGNVLSKTDARGTSFSYNYDLLNRLTLSTPSDGTPIVEYLYDQSSQWGYSLSNGIGRMTSEYTFPGWGQQYNQAALFNHDAMGHVTSELDCLPSVCPNNFILSISATYDLAGETTSLTYPDGQKVNYTYDTAEHALSAIGADNTNYTYNATYWPNGAQYRQWWSPNIYGRTDLNNRLQVAAFYSDNGVTPSYYLSKSYSYSTQNNGNVLEIYNNKDTTRNQSFTYDSLNRLTHAENSGTDCTLVLGDGHTEYWGNTYVYDAWGNLYQKNVTKCSAENMQATVTAQNRLSGNSYSYDANGNMLYDGLHHYTYDGENRITQVDSGVTSYLYDSMGSRVSKTSANLSWTEYVDFGGNVIAERSTLALNSAMLSGSGFASGDFYTGAIVDGSTACCGFETDHESAGTWLQVDLGAGNTQAVVEARIYAATANYPGNWTVQYSDNASTWTAAAINFVPSRLGWNATGWASVGAHRYWRLYLTNTPGPGGWLNELQLVAETNYVFFNGKRVARRDPSGAVHYYLSDHLGSTTMVVSAAGAIENESDYYPWGGELKITAADAGNHYKFTGKERDAESGLDYFGARYYGNAFGRFLTPDWGAYPSPIPYSDLQDPQSFNRYSYVRNAPTSSVDPDGHDCTSDKNGNVHCVVREKLPNSDPPKAGDPHKTASQEPYFQYRINRWIHRMNQRIDNALAPFYQHFQNTLDILDPCPHKEMSCGVVFPIGGIDPVLKGMAGVLRATAEIEAEGGQVVATEVTMRNSAGTARVDLVYKDADGTLKLGEAKNGPTAGLNPNQRAVYDAAAREGATFVGGNARVAGLTSIGPTAVRLFKY